MAPRSPAQKRTGLATARSAALAKLAALPADERSLEQLSKSIGGPLAVYGGVPAAWRDTSPSI